MTTAPSTIISTIAQRSKDANVFGKIETSDNMISCQAWGSAEPAFYRLYLDGETPIVELATVDRWLSGSIEGDLVGSGDKLDDLIEDELIFLGYHEDSGAVAFDHYRSDDMEYVFRSKVIPMPGQDLADACMQWLLAYEICFRQLGDMDESEED